jgi:hypothetical protein
MIKKTVLIMNGGGKAAITTMEPITLRCLSLQS